LWLNEPLGLSFEGGVVTEIGYFDDNEPYADHAGRSVRSGATSVFARAVIALIQIASVLVLARLLTPRDYGLVTMATAVIGFAPLLTDLGIQDAITQRSRITHAEVSALFWITVAVGVSFAALVAASGPIIARFYGEARLTPIVLVSSLSFVAYAMTVQHSALMRRALMFRQLAIIEVGANALSAVCAIWIALVGHGYWALVARQVGTPMLYAAGVWSASRWMPGRGTITQGVKDALKFGLHITGFGMADFAGRSGDRIAIGSRAGATMLGQYQSAILVFENLASILVAPLHPVAVASLSKIRDNPQNLRAAWSKALATLAFYAMPAFGLLAVTSQDVVVVLLGAKWAGAGVLLAVLAIRGIPQTVERTAGWLHVTAGHTERWMRYGVFASGAQLAALFCGLPFGLMGIVIAYVISMFILFVPALTYAGRPLGIGAADILGAVWRQLLASLVSAGIGFAVRWTLLTRSRPIAATVLLSLVYLSSYLAIAVGILRLRAPFRTARWLIRGAVPLATADAS
jgi:PST family polysaccharide transporter